jgi:uncharacterized protein YoxC
MSIEKAASRELAPAISNRETTEKDPTILEQFASEISQATEYLRHQTDRIRMHTDRMVGAEPQPEDERKTDGLDHVRPTIEGLAQAIRDLHNSTGQLSAQLDRLEGHRLT